jgi:hypothetical protein
MYLLLCSILSIVALGRCTMHGEAIKASELHANANFAVYGSLFVLALWFRNFRCFYCVLLTELILIKLIHFFDEYLYSVFRYLETVWHVLRGPR